jgi:resuscitation-promoting factor RpfB
VRSKIVRLGNNRAALIILVTVVVLALAGTTFGFAKASKAVTLSLDGQAQQVHALGGTVGEVLDSEGIEVGEHDVVAPSLDEPVQDGDRITVRFGRELTLEVDGKPASYWVTATDVNGALSQIGRSFNGAELSASRGAEISRDGLRLAVVTPKNVKIKIGNGKFKREHLTALTVEDVLKELDVDFDKDDQVKPALDTEISDGDKVVVTDIRIKTKSVKGEAIDFETIETEDSSMYEGEETVERSGVEGLRNVTYKLVFRNGELTMTKVLKQDVIREPVDALVAVGTKEQSTTDYSGGGTVWDSIAACEAGGNWATNTGNGYYGGLQFSLSTWQAYGGSGLPSDNSREEQIRIAEKVVAATGGYGSWPACSQSLGLPQ